LFCRFVLPLLTGAILLAEDPSANPQPPDLRIFLNLSDSQIQSLVQLQQQRGQALQPVVQQVAQNQQKLREILAAPNPDPPPADIS
jgi:hypothetical protein